jgi:uncharacterized protein
VKWYRKAAEQGETNGQYSLGVMYDNGNGVAQDYAEAAKVVQQGRRAGNANGQYSLGAMYLSGQVVPQDYVQAHMWLNLAADGFRASDAGMRKRAVCEHESAANK